MITESVHNFVFNYGEFAIIKNQTIGLQAKVGLKELSYDA
jgi:hypothetical protein